MHRQGIFEYHVSMSGATATANSSGVAKASWGPVPFGYCWYIERYSGFCPTAATTVSVYVAQGATGTATVDPLYLADYSVLAAGVKGVTGDASMPIYVPEGYHFIFQWENATNNDACKGSIQYAVHQLEPLAGEAITSGQDIRQLAEGHPYLGETPVTRSAVGPEAE